MGSRGRSAYAGGLVRRLATAGLAALALLLAACGGDDAGTSTDTSKATKAPDQPGGREPIPQAEFVKRADAICADARREAEQLSERIATERPPDANSGAAVLAKTLVEPGLEIRERQAARLRSLPPPVDAGTAYETFVGLFDVMNELLRERLAIGLEGGIAEAQDLEALIFPLGDEQRLAARELGLKNCDLDQAAIILEPPQP